MGFLSKLFGVSKGKKVSGFTTESSKSEQEKSVAGDEKESSKSRYELKAGQKREPQLQVEGTDSAASESFATIGLQRLKSRTASQVKPSDEMVGDASKPFSAYGKRKSVPEKIAQSFKQHELVDLGEVTSTFPKEGMDEEFTLLNNYSPARPPQAPPSEPKLPPPIPKEAKPVVTSEQPQVSGPLKDKLIVGMDIPEASLKYHKERVEFKAESDKQGIESVLERFGPASEPTVKSEGVIVKAQDSAKKVEVEPAKPAKPVIEKPTGKFKAGRFIHPPFKKPKKTLEDVMVMPKPNRPSYKPQPQKTFAAEPKPVRETKHRGEKKAAADLVNAFSRAFETLFSSDTSLPQGEAESPAGLIEYHPDEVDDLNQMFLQMLSNYLKPLEDGFDTLERGEYDEETVAGLLGAVRPLRSAALTMNFEKISELLREIEEPLQVYRQGELEKFRPTQLASMVLSYRELFKILPRAKVTGDVTRFSAASELLKILRAMPEVTSEYVEKLFACGYSNLDAVRATLPYEISITCSIPEEIAYKIHTIVLESVEREV